MSCGPTGQSGPAHSRSCSRLGVTSFATSTPRRGGRAPLGGDRLRWRHVPDRTYSHLRRWQNDQLDTEDWCREEAGADRRLSRRIVVSARDTAKAERLRAGEAWEARGHVLADELGRPYHADYLSNRFDKLVKDSGLPRIRLHDTRHTACSLMLASGVPVKVVQELAGHSSPKSCSLCTRTPRPAWAVRPASSCQRDCLARSAPFCLLSHPLCVRVRLMLTKR